MLGPDGDVYVGWRLLEADPPELAFNIYRARAGGDPVKLNDAPITATTDFVDPDPGDVSRTRYSVRPVLGGEKLEPSEPALVSNPLGRPYITIPLQGDYTFQKVGIADLDGDGLYDFVIKQPDVNVDPFAPNWRPSEGTYKIEAYLNDGTFLWRNDLGWAIEQGMWYSPYVVYDLDGDGLAEVAVKTGEGDPRDLIGRVWRGPEHLTVWDGLTGRAVACTTWPERMEFYNWFSRNQIGLAFLDGERPSLIVGRGTYCGQKIEAYRYEAGRLENLWRWESGLEEGACGGGLACIVRCGLLHLGLPVDPGYHGQGAHFMHSADVDGDGRDEVVLGSSVIDDDGTGLWANGLGHCDHAYVGDIDPARPGLEIYYGYETPKTLPAGNGVCLADAATGAILWGIDTPTYHVHNSGLVSDIDPSRPGMECYSGEKEYPARWLHAADGELIADERSFDPGLSPRAVYWDSDPQRELLVGGSIYDYETGHVHLEGISGRQAAWADVLGDWREEIIVSIAGELRIYTTTIPATDRRVCLMQDPIYRLDVAHLAMGYAQPPMTSTCLDQTAGLSSVSRVCYEGRE